MTTCLERAVHSVSCACLVWAFVNLLVCFFRFWFCGWDVGFDCISSYSLPFFLLYLLKTNVLDFSDDVINVNICSARTKKYHFS